MLLGQTRTLRSCVPVPGSNRSAVNQVGYKQCTIIFVTLQPRSRVAKRICRYGDSFFIKDVPPFERILSLRSYRRCLSIRPRGTQALGRRSPSKDQRVYIGATNASLCHVSG